MTLRTFGGAAAVIARVVEVIAGILLAAILVLAMGEIIFRYVTDHSLVWVDELSRLLFVWLIFLAAAVAFHHRLHFRVVLLWRALSVATRKRLEVLIDALTLVFAAVLFWQSLHIIERTQVQRTTAMEIPMSTVYTIVPIAAALVVVFIVLRWLEAMRTRSLRDPVEEHHA